MSDYMGWDRTWHLGFQNSHSPEEVIGFQVVCWAKPCQDGASFLFLKPNFKLGGPCYGLWEIQAVVVAEFGPLTREFRVGENQHFDDLWLVPACGQAADIRLIDNPKAEDGACQGVVREILLFGRLLVGHGFLLLITYSYAGVLIFHGALPACDPLACSHVNHFGCPGVRLSCGTHLLIFFSNAFSLDTHHFVARSMGLSTG